MLGNFLKVRDEDKGELCNLINKIIGDDLFFFFFDIVRFGQSTNQYNLWKHRRERNNTTNNHDGSKTHLKHHSTKFHIRKWW